MNSWDLFGSLVAGRDASKRDGDQDEHIPVAQNIARVERGSLIISDFYDGPKAERVLHEVAGLQNELIVTHDGKATGAVWERLQQQGRIPEKHIGDDGITDLAVPSRYGIECELTFLARMTEAELKFSLAGFPGLAGIMRESRLRTWDENQMYRGLQLFQSQCNLPFLFLASLLLYNRVGSRRRVLMSSRDCWLWARLFDALMWTPPFGGKVQTQYFYTSRLTRYQPTASYYAYMKKIWTEYDNPIIVDLCGFGDSLASILKNPQDEAILLVGYGQCKLPHIMSGYMNEVTNFARHPMVADVDADGQPVFVNPLGIEWERVPELKVMHEAFLLGVEAVKHYDFSRDFAHSDKELLELLYATHNRFDEYANELGTLTEFRVKEAQATSDLLAARGLTKGVVT